MTMGMQSFEAVKYYPLEVKALSQTCTEKNCALYSYCSLSAEVLEQKRKKALDIANQISRDNARRVITMYLSDSKITFDMIAETICYSLRQTKRFYQSGIEELLSNGYLTA